MNLEKAVVADTETYPNCFVLVSKSLKDGEILKFVIGDERDDYELLKNFLRTKPTFIGFNSLAFDALVIELIWRSETPVTTKQIYDFVDDFIAKRKEDRWYLPYPEWELSFLHLDLLKICHYDNPSKMTSLKWLEYTMHWPKMADMPLPIGSIVPPSSVTKLVSYCVNDVLVTELFFKKCSPMIELRADLSKKYNNFRILNMSDSSIGEYVLKEELKKEGIKESDLKKIIPRKKIAVKDCLLDYINFQSPELNSVLAVFQDMKIENIEENGLKGIHNQEIVFKGLPTVFGIGGIHSATRPGVYESDDKYIICTIDCKSYYPFLAIVNKFFPQHIGEKFCPAYRRLYDERLKHPKGSALNYAYKIALNASFGKSNSKFSFLYDPKMTISITVNGQLLLAMLAEELSNLGELLMINTDGLEIRIPREKEKELKETCGMWEALTGLELEYGYYNKLVLRDVNNYIAISDTGKAKRKGFFQVYEDYTGEDGSEHSFHGSPNGTIIPLALFKYYTEGIPPEITIGECDSIYPFAFGLKGRKNFEYWLIQAQEDGFVDIETRNERAIRYFLKKKGANMFKFWLDERKNKLQSVKKDYLVETCMNITKGGELISIKKRKGQEDEVVINYEPDRDAYIQLTYETINNIERGITDEVVVDSLSAE
jgi:hypothetical protein